jgi:hypothetical protein
MCPELQIFILGAIFLFLAIQGQVLIWQETKSSHMTSIPEWLTALKRLMFYYSTWLKHEGKWWTHDQGDNLNIQSTLKRGLIWDLLKWNYAGPWCKAYVIWAASQSISICIATLYTWGLTLSDLRAPVHPSRAVAPAYRVNSYPAFSKELTFSLCFTVFSGPQKHHTFHKDLPDHSSQVELEASMTFSHIT